MGKRTHLIRQVFWAWLLLFQPLIAGAQDAEFDEAAIDLGPEQDANESNSFRLPPGPVEGGVIKVPHPDAKKGLIRINKDGSYLYKTETRSKAHTIALRAGQMPPPLFSQVGVTYEEVYGSNDLFIISGEYEWIPYQQFGFLGLVIGGGFATASGNGVLANERVPSEEGFDLYIFPLTAALKYRFEFLPRQWLVPYVKASATMFGLAEKRDDNPTPTLARAFAVGGGGGANISLTRWSRDTEFIMGSEYGIADFWLNVEFIVLKGLEEEADFSNNLLSVGLAFDY